MGRRLRFHFSERQRLSSPRWRRCSLDCEPAWRRYESAFKWQLLHSTRIPLQLRTSHPTILARTYNLVGEGEHCDTATVAIALLKGEPVDQRFERQLTPSPSMGGNVKCPVRLSFYDSSGNPVPLAGEGQTEEGKPRSTIGSRAMRHSF